MQRSSGILLHPTALPHALPIGDLGQQADRFVDFLARAGQSVWQILPLGPTGFGHSPYNALSAFAGNPVLIDLAQLVRAGDLDGELLNSTLNNHRDSGFDEIHDLKQSLLRQAAQRFFCAPETGRQQHYRAFCAQHADWLDDFSLYMALREKNAGRSWADWAPELRSREPAALATARRELGEPCNLHRYQQFVFSEQWQKLKSTANRKGIRIFGDIPIFVAYDSADVWAHQHLFQLDPSGRPTAVAGVPPDYFSKTGQRWGNPLYRWEEHSKDGFQWWLQRFHHQQQLCDMVRIDHFRGFQACWSIPATEKTAVNGTWQEVPGRELFQRLQADRDILPIVAEDLGFITTDVEALRNDFGFPGMKILQFAFDSGPGNPYLPENYATNCVVYTGTHDNNTTLGWWQSLAKTQKDQVRSYLGQSRPEMPWALIRLAMASAADLCILPCQDILALGQEARFNTPGRATGNWQWQMTEDLLTDALADRLRALTEKHRRV